MEVKIFFAGDFFAPNGFPTIDGFKGVQPHLYEADYAVVNFEAPVVDSGTCHPIQKTGPCLKMSRRDIEVLKEAKFGLLTLANNHFRDYGDKGCVATLNTCRDLSMDYVGGGVDINEATSIFYKKIKGVSFAFINVCESEFSIATSTRPGSAPIDEFLYCRVVEAKKRASFLVVIVHGGKEHYQLPTPRQKRLACALVDLGCNAVIMHHAHCFCGYEVYNNAPIFYGLGNFFFPTKRVMPKFWYYGCAVTLTFSGERVDYALHPYKQAMGNHWGISVLDDSEGREFQDQCRDFRKKISSLETLISFFSECRSSLFPFEPYPNWKIFRFLYRKRCLPSFLSQERRRLILNLIRCETHRDSLIDVLSREKF